MSDPSDPSREEVPAADLELSPGRRLRQARRRRGYEIGQVARELRLPLDRVAALENDNYEGLPAPVFVAGYLKTYARLVGLDPEPLVQAYRAALPPSSPTEPAQVIVSSVQERHERLIGRLAAIAALIFIALLTFAWWAQHPGDGTAPPTGEPVVELPVPDGADLPAASPASAPGESPDEPTGELTEEVMEVVEEEDPGEAVPAAALEGEGMEETAAPEASPEDITVEADGPFEADVAEVVNKLEVVVAFSGPCWVDIRDSTRNYALVGEMDKGDRHLLGGKPPYSLIIGNAAAAQILVDGQPFDFKSVVRGNVARFSLDPASRP